MKIRFRLLSRFGLSISLILILLSAVSVFAQSSDDQAAQTVFAGMFLLFALIVGAAVYVYFALALQTIAKVATARRKPEWWGILMIVPLVNMVVPGYLAWAD